LLRVAHYHGTDVLSRWQDLVAPPSHSACGMLPTHALSVHSVYCYLFVDCAHGTAHYVVDVTLRHRSGFTVVRTLRYDKPHTAPVPTHTTFIRWLQPHTAAAGRTTAFVALLTVPHLLALPLLRNSAPTPPHTASSAYPHTPHPAFPHFDIPFPTFYCHTPPHHPTPTFHTPPHPTRCHTFPYPALHRCISG